jgi:hypothetical protein
MVYCIVYFIARILVAYSFRSGITYRTQPGPKVSRIYSYNSSAIPGELWAATLKYVTTSSHMLQVV